VTKRVASARRSSKVGASLIRSRRTLGVAGFVRAARLMRERPPNGQIVELDLPRVFQGFRNGTRVLLNYWRHKQQFETETCGLEDAPHVPMPGEYVLGAFRQALGSCCDVGDPRQRAAYEMAMTGVFALVLSDPKSEQAVAVFDAHRRGAQDPNSDVLTILDLQNQVAIAAYLWNREERVHGPPAQSWPRCAVRIDAALGLHDWLAQQYGVTRIPTEEQIVEWLNKHAKRGVRGKLSTERIVTRIIVHGNLFGARTEKQVYDQVKKAIQRRT
jgi:hypothetical protein